MLKNRLFDLMECNVEDIGEPLTYAMQFTLIGSDRVIDLSKRISIGDLGEFKISAIEANNTYVFIPEFKFSGKALKMITDGYEYNFKDKVKLSSDFVGYLHHQLSFIYELELDEIEPLISHMFYTIIEELGSAANKVVMIENFGAFARIGDKVIFEADKLFKQMCKNDTLGTMLYRQNNK